MLFIRNRYELHLLERNVSRKRLAVGLKPAVFTARGPSSFSALPFSRN